MPNRTIYLPDDVDRLARELDVNLSRVTQEAVRRLAERRRDHRAAQLAAIRHKVAEAALSFPAHDLDDMRRDAGDDLR